MNILYIYSSNIIPTKGGVQRVTQVLCDSFRQNGHNCYYLSSQITDEGIPNQFVLPHRIVCSNVNIIYIQKFIRDYSVNIVVNQDGLDKAMTSLVHQACFGKTKIITVAHNSLLAPAKYFSEIHYSQFKRGHFTWALPLFNYTFVKSIIYFLYLKKYSKHYREILRYSDKFVLLSNAYIKELNFFVSDIPKDKVISIFNPCTISNEDWEEHEKMKIVLYVGRISYPQKRNDLLFRIWSKVEPNYPNWTLYIVGDGEDASKLRKLSKSLHLKNVRFEGFQVPNRYYKNASILCLTSAFEGLPLVIAEAMDYGVVPIVFNSFGSASDIITNEKDGLLVEPFSCDDYVEKLQGLMDDNRDNYINNAKEKSKLFSLDNIVSQWLELFIEVKNG